MKYLSLFAAAFALMLGAQDINFTFQGKGGKNLPPKVEKLTEGSRTYYRCTPVEKEPWQALQITPDKPIDLSKYRAVSFEFRQKFYSADDPAVCCYINCPGGAVYTDFAGGSRKNWKKVEIPFDTRIWKGSEKIGFTTANVITVYPYQNLDDPKKSLEISNIRFLPKFADNSPRKIAVRSYKINAVPTDGPDNAKALTDGKTDFDIHFRGYGNVEPIFDFDLGTIHVITELKLTASGKEAGQNFRSANISASIDGKKYFPAGSINDMKMVGKLQLYTFKMPFAARYIKISPIRTRQDFPIRIAEAEFTGYIPDSKELAKFSERAYDEGKPLPKDNGQNYVTVKKGEYSFKICKDNGILSDIRFKGELIALKKFMTYVLLYRKKDIVTDAYSDKISNFTFSDGIVKYSAVNPKIPELVLNYEVTIDQSGILTTVTVDDSKAKEKAFLRISTQTVFDKDFRRDGYYESWGGYHRLERFAASEVVGDKVIDGSATLTFEGRNGKKTLFETLTTWNGIFMPLGTNPEGDRATQYFLANGQRLCIASINIGDNKKETVCSLWMMSDGTLLDAYAKFFKRAEYANFVNSQPRAPWLRDVKLAGTLGGWEGYWIGAHERAAENMAKLYEYDPVVVAMLGGLNGTWGDFYYGEGNVGKGFEQGFAWGMESNAKALRERYQNLRKINPTLKLGVYNWLWSAGANSNIFAKHPDWFISKTREGSAANYFPGAEIVLNFLRKFSHEASRKDAVDTICKQMNGLDLDVFYLDGGIIGAFAEDWENMKRDEMTGPLFMHDEIRRRMMKDNPERAVFFNCPYNPQGDFGFLESFSDIVSNWRNGAINMYKFKLFQYRNKLHYPIYIYWIGTTNGPLEDYMIGTGLLPSLHSRGKKVGDVGYISGRHQVRQLEMVEAAFKPNWRFDADTALEAFTMKQEKSAFIFLKNHAKETKKELISFNAAPFGFDPAKPVYAYAVRVKNANDYECSFGEPAIREAYEKFNWISDRVTVPVYMGEVKIVNGRISAELELPSNIAVLYTLTQVPAFVWSYRGHPTYHRISGMPGLTVTGDYNALTVNAEEKNSEIAIIIPEGKVPASITVNGESAKWNSFRDNGVMLAVVKIPAAGKSEVKAAFADAEKLSGTPELKVRRFGYNLRTVLTVPESYNGKEITLSISDGENTVYSQNVKVVSGKNNINIKLPTTTLDARYVITAGIPGNPTATAKSTVRALARKTELQVIMQSQKEIPVEKACDLTVKGMKVSKVISIGTENCSDATVDPQNLSVDIKTRNQMATYWNKTAGALELNNVKRYIKIKMASNLWVNNKYGSSSSGRHSPRYETPSHYIGLFLDFGTKDGYTVRAAGAYGKFDVENKTVLFNYGANRLPQHYWMFNDMARSQTLKEVTVWLDLWNIGAPANWDNRLLVSAVMTHCSANKNISFQILDTADALPAGEKVEDVLSLTKKEEKVTVKVPKVAKKPTWADWKKIPAAGVAHDLLDRVTKPKFPMTAKVAHDGKNLYFYYDIVEKADKIFDCREGDNGLPFFSDSVEAMVAFNNDPGMFFHTVVDAKGNTYKERYTDKAELKHKAKKKIIFPSTHELDVKNPAHWQAMFIVPLKEIGVTQVSGTKLHFNMMHNRLDDGKMVNSALGFKYYSGDQYTLVLE